MRTVRVTLAEHLMNDCLQEGAAFVDAFAFAEETHELTQEEADELERRHHARSRRQPPDWRPVTGRRAADWHGLFDGDPGASLVAGIVAYSLIYAAVWGIL